MSNHITYIFLYILNNNIHRKGITINKDRVPWEFLEYWREPEHAAIWCEWMDINPASVLLERTEIDSHSNCMDRELSEHDIIKPD
jgi:hypothetical protein